MDYLEIANGTKLNKVEYKREVTVDEYREVATKLKEILEPLMSDEAKKAIRDGWQNFLCEQSKIENQYDLKIERIGEYVKSIGAVLPETFDDFVRWYFRKYPDLKYLETFPNVSDSHLQEYSELRKDELYKIFTPKKNTPETKTKKRTPKTLQKCFSGIDSYNKALQLLRNTRPCIIDNENNYKAGERNKSAISEWVRYIHGKPEYCFKQPSKKILVQLLNAEFKGLDMGNDGRTLDNPNTQYRRKISTAG